MQRGLFWPLILAASILEAVAAASLATAVFSDPVPRGVIDSGSQSEIFGRSTLLDWSSDRGLLVSASICFALGIAAFVVAARSR